ncbi:MAG: AbrB/MazE/SpoVT family DNA-binding domain-containing protein [Promethearchaeota archaeon]
MRLHTMEFFVKVTRKGQTTIPVKIREKHNITEHTILRVEDTPNGILFVPQQSIFNYAGCLSDSMSPEQGKAILDELREEN